MILQSMSKLQSKTIGSFRNRDICLLAAKGYLNRLNSRSLHLVSSRRAFSSSSSSTLTTQHSSVSSDAPPFLFRQYDLQSPECNVTPLIASRVGTNLHLRPKHPLNTIKTIIEEYWKKRVSGRLSIHDDIDPVVSTRNNFDSLLIPQDHVSRSKSDTYYLNNETVLRTHTSAHQTTLLQAGQDCFLVTGDVYR